MTTESTAAIMKSEAQRIAIAEACGWTREPSQNEMSPMEWWWKSPDGVIARPTKPETHLPDYLSDLNAMHEAEKVLTDNQMDDYCRAIKKIVCKEEFVCGYRYYFCATAAQRAEAFLRTFNLWKDE